MSDTLEEERKLVQRVCDYLFCHSSAVWEALGKGEKDPALKRARAASTLGEAVKAYYSAGGNKVAEVVALGKCRNFALEKAKAASTLEEAVEAFHNSWGNRAAENLAIKKVADFLRRN